MKKCYVISAKVEDDYIWQVFEPATNQVLDSFYFEEDAFDLATFYDEGGGFAGFTPSFMLQSVTLNVTNVNEEFTRKFA